MSNFYFLVYNLSCGNAQLGEFMKIWKLFALLFTLFITVQCKSSQELASLEQAGDRAAFSEYPQFSERFDLKDYSGTTFLNFMKVAVKPGLDRIATNGYQIGDVGRIEESYKSSFTKIRRRVDGPWGGLEKVKGIASKLEGQTVTLENLPMKIRAVDSRADIYNLATFLGLANGGGAVIKFANGNFGLNVHYDVTEQKSGRSFGVGPGRAANDASDKDYLTDLGEYAGSSPQNLDEFYTALLEALLNSDPTNYLKVSNEGQAILSDFLAVYTAEQVRNLMDGEVKPHWDAALLEVTLLAGFHGGQRQFQLFYLKPGTAESVWTTTTFKQTNCKLPENKGKAGLVDYWQFSRNINDPKNCRRSGINITKNEFRLLGKRITSYLRDNYNREYSKLTSAMGVDSAETNIYNALSRFLISSNAPSKIPSDRVRNIVKSWVVVLEIVNKDANQISQLISKENVPPNDGQPVVEDANINLDVD